MFSRKITTRVAIQFHAATHCIPAIKVVQNHRLSADRSSRPEPHIIYHENHQHPVLECRPANRQLRFHLRYMRRRGEWPITTRFEL